MAAPRVNRFLAGAQLMGMATVWLVAWIPMAMAGLIGAAFSALGSRSRRPAP